MKDKLNLDEPNEYYKFLDSKLKPITTASVKAIDLFAGCGGLALGFEAQGFETIGYEMDSVCCETYNQNLQGECINEVLTADTEFPSVKVVIGGPPCQPFSVIGNQNGLGDSRNGFPIFISAIRRLNPDIFVFENVRGLLYRSRAYFEQVLTELRALNYIVEYELLNAVDFEVPQSRERLIVVGHRGPFEFPVRAKRQISAGEALGKMATEIPADSKFLSPSMDEYIARYEKASHCIRPRDLHLDAPARTLTCRNLAGATSDMQRIRMADGRRRRLVPKEAARLQSFPDWFKFSGTETQQFNQIGNAVPPMLAYHVASAVKQCLDSHMRFEAGEIACKNLPAQTELNLVSEPKEEYMPEFIALDKKRDISRVINEALLILSKLGIPFDGLSNRRLEKMAMAFLAVCNVKRPKQWKGVIATKSNRALTSREIIKYVNDNFEENISSGSYDDIRRKDLKLPVVSGLILKSANVPGAATNNPTRAYALNPEYAQVVSAFGTKNWEEDVDEFIKHRETLSERLDDSRPVQHIPVKLPSGLELHFSAGKHNELQKAIIEEFLPRFGESSEVLYVGDASNKFLHLVEKDLKELNFFEISHDELPDVIAYSRRKNWLYLIEAVHSSGPISAIRHEELLRLTKKCTAEIIYVTAFLDRDTFRKFAPEIAWETEVWIADSPDHIIHFDGIRFLGPYARGVIE